jgi:hypothetical protein
MVLPSKDESKALAAPALIPLLEQAALVR